jgi:hypothetical protein
MTGVLIRRITTPAAPSRCACRGRFAAIVENCRPKPG